MCVCVAELQAMECGQAEEVVSRLQVVEAVAGAVGDALWARLARGLHALAALARAPHSAVRHMAARALAAGAARDPHTTLPTLLPQVNCALVLTYRTPLTIQIHISPYTAASSLKLVLHFLIYTMKKS